jgi:hypothetical protein
MRAILFALAVLVIFTVFVTVFAASAPAAAVRVLPKWLWVALCLVATPIGGVLYLTLGRPIDGPSSGSARATTRLAPDDDPEFLRNLARRLKDQKPKDQKPEDQNPDA